VSDLVKYVDLGDRMAYAKALAEASLLPAAYRKAPANILLAMEYGEALGLAPVAAIQGIHVVDGKPTASAQLIGALVRRAGHRLRVETAADGQSATATVIRSDDPDFVFRSHWDMVRATAAGLAGKGTWKLYPANMLKARAITEVARDACPEVLSGVAYTAEELESVEPGPAYIPPAPELEPEPERYGYPADMVDAELVEDVLILDEVIDLNTTIGREEFQALMAEEARSYNAPGPLGRAQRSAPATADQVRYLRAQLAERYAAIEPADVLDMIAPALADAGLGDLTDLSALSKRQASHLLDLLKAGQMTGGRA
jgi:hypothetical protein